MELSFYLTQTKTGKLTYSVVQTMAGGQLVFISGTTVIYVSM